VSFVGTSEFMKEAGAEGDGVYITQVMPSPDDASIPLVKQYQQDMKGASLSYTSLEGYANAVVLVEALKKTGAAPTREGLVGALEGLTTDIGGVKIAYSSSSHQGAKQVFVTKVQGGKATPVAKL
jgi:ABC-type branched-subunit amino acid transport system substrate-binding protein